MTTQETTIPDLTINEQPDGSILIHLFTDRAKDQVLGLVMTSNTREHVVTFGYRYEGSPLACYGNW